MDNSNLFDCYGDMFEEHKKAVIEDVIKVIKQYHIEKIKELEAVEIDGDEYYDNAIWDIIDQNAYIIRYIKKHYGLV